jgi:putative heme-binding domain-containing protein
MAVRGLTLFDDPALGKMLVEDYRKFRREEDQAAVIAGLVTRPAWAASLVAAIKEGDIPRQAITPFQARQILAMKNEDLTRELREVWGEVRQPDGALEEKIAVLEESLTAEVLAKGNKPGGRVLFQTLCASCHQLYGQGGKLGPDLTGSGRADLGYLLQNIVAPNSVVPAEYQMSLVTLKDGRVLGGVVATSDDRTLTLRTPTGEIALERSAIAESKRLSDSLMPPGLLDSLSPEQIRDLIAYLMHPRQVALPEKKR